MMRELAYENLIKPEKGFPLSAMMSGTKVYLNFKENENEKELQKILKIPSKRLGYYPVYQVWDNAYPINKHDDFDGLIYNYATWLTPRVKAGIPKLPECFHVVYEKCDCLDCEAGTIAFNEPYWGWICSNCGSKINFYKKEHMDDYCQLIGFIDRALMSERIKL